MAKKKLNELDPATVTLTRLLGHGHPSTGKMNRTTVGDLVALILSGQAPVKTYADETALLANTDLVVGYIALNADTGAFYLYNGPDADDIDNYTQINAEVSEHFKGVYVDDTALTTAHPSAESGDYAYVDAGVGNPVELWIWDDDDSEWVQSGSPAGGTWGSITGTLSSQADLQAALDLKFSIAQARATRTVTGASASVQSDDNSLIIFNSATPFNFTLDQLTASSKISYINIGAGAVTFVNGTGVTQVGDTVISAAAGNTFPTGLTFWGTATTPRNVLSQGPSLSLDSADVSGGTITLDLLNQVQKLFLGSASFATPKTIALSNAGNGLVINFKFNLSNVAAVLTFPASFTMQTTDLRWNDGAHTFTPAATGLHEFSATFDGTDWHLKVTNPFS